MGTLKELVDNTISSNEYQKMLRSIAPFRDYLGLTEVAYWRVTDKGQYCYVGSRADWTEFAMQHFHPTEFPCIRLPEQLNSGVSFMRISSSEKYRNILDTAWKKFGLNLAVNIQYKNRDGVESFGFCTNDNHDNAEETLLRELPLIYKFIEFYRNENAHLIQLTRENQVDLSAELTGLPKQTKLVHPDTQKRTDLLRHYGWQDIESLTKREMDIIKYLAHGYHAYYIAQETSLSIRTVENYIAVIKCKLCCDSKITLIKKSQEIAGISNFYYRPLQMN